MKRAQKLLPLHNHNDICSRRAFLGAGALFTWTFGSAQHASSQISNVSDNVIGQPSSPSNKTFMQRAFEMRDMAIKKGDQAYGAIVVRNGLIIGQSWSRVILDKDPTAHAEIAAIRDAARRLNNRDLSGAVMYSSSRPCPMCGLILGGY